MDNEEFKEEFNDFTNDFVDIKQRVRFLSEKIMVPDEEGSEFVIFTFKKMTCEDHWKIEKECSITYDTNNTDTEDRKPQQITSVDYQEFKKQVLKRMIHKTSIFDIKRNKKEELTKETEKSLMGLPAPLLEAILEKYEDTVHLSDEEEATINKQASILFAKNSQGVENACEAVSLFCNLGNFWEKFGIDRFNIKKLPYREYVMLKIMISKENSATAARNAAASSKKTGNVSIGGKVQKSRGVVIPDTGQSF